MCRLQTSIGSAVSTHPVQFCYFHVLVNWFLERLKTHVLVFMNPKMDIIFVEHIRGLDDRAMRIRNYRRSVKQERRKSASRSVRILRIVVAVEEARSSCCKLSVFVIKTLGCSSCCHGRKVKLRHHCRLKLSRSGC
jgi:hypothetical protein